MKYFPTEERNWPVFGQGNQHNTLQKLFKNLSSYFQPRWIIKSVVVNLFFETPWLTLDFAEDVSFLALQIDYSRKPESHYKPYTKLWRNVLLEKRHLTILTFYFISDQSFKTWKTDFKQVRQSHSK